MKKLLLSLGTVAAVIAPVATVVSCGAKTLKDVIKEDVKKINSSDLSKEVKSQDILKVQAMKNKKDLSALMESIFPKPKPPKTPLELARDTYTKKIQEINLPWTQTQDFTKQITEAKDENAMKEIMKVAEAAKKVLDKQSKETLYSHTRGQDLANVAKMKILLADKDKAIKIIEGSTPEDTDDIDEYLKRLDSSLKKIKNAFDEAESKEVKPTVKKASKDGFVITNPEGYKLYIPDGKKGTSVTLVDSTAIVQPQNVTKYEVTTASTKTELPVVKILKTDGTYSATKIIVAKAKEDDLVLEDYSGVYYSIGNEVSASGYLINFMNANLRLTGDVQYDIEKIRSLLIEVVPNPKAAFTLEYDDENKLTSCTVGSKGIDAPDFGSTTGENIDRTGDFKPVPAQFLIPTDFLDGPDKVDFGSDTDENIDKTGDFEPVPAQFSASGDFLDGPDVPDFGSDTDENIDNTGDFNPSSGDFSSTTGFTDN